MLHPSTSPAPNNRRPLHRRRGEGDVQRAAQTGARQGGLPGLLGLRGPERTPARPNVRRPGLRGSDREGM